MKVILLEWCVWNFQGTYGLKFLYYMENMLKLMGSMRVDGTSSMFMESSEAMMPGSA
jgi:hypothetical protein